MSETILTALIASTFSFAGVIVANHSSRKKAAVEQARRDQKLDDRLDRLEKKVDEHNRYGKKFGEVATAMAALQKDIEYLRKIVKI